VFKNYVKIAFKVFMRRKFFTFVSLFGSSLTLAVLVAAAILLDYYLGAHPPEVNKGRTLKVGCLTMTKADDMNYNMSGNPSLRFLDRHVRTLESPEKVCVYSRNRTVVTYVGDEKVALSLKHVDSAYWEVLRFNFIEGRPFTAQEDAGGERLAVIGAETRQRLFGAESPLGKRLEADDRSFRVIGVVEDVARVQSNAHADLWVPIGTAGQEVRENPSLRGRFEALLLARTEADIPRIKEEYQTALTRVEPSDPRFDVVYSTADTPFEEIARETFGWRTFREGYHKGRLMLLWALLALLFMALPALNMINLNLSRILERASEIGVRKAFGAPSGSLVGQFLVENVLLSLIGGGLGFGLSYLVVYAVGQGFEEYRLAWGVSIRVFAIGLAVTVVFGLISGLYPAWRMSRLHPAQALRGGRR
jgi:putative ABC transport system permease protein